MSIQFFIHERGGERKNYRALFISLLKRKLKLSKLNHSVMLRILSHSIANISFTQLPRTIRRERETRNINSFYDSHKTCIISVFLRKSDRGGGRRGQGKRGADCIRTISTTLCYTLYDGCNVAFCSSTHLT